MSQSSEKLSNACNNPGIDHIEIERPGLKEFHTTAIPSTDRSFATLMNQVALMYRKQEARIVKMDVFGSYDTFKHCLDTIEKKFNSRDWPLNYVISEHWKGHKIAGAYIHAISGVEIRTLKLEGQSYGRVFEDDSARYCILGNVHAVDGSLSKAKQTQNIFEIMETGLQLAGMEFTNIVRTWFFNYEILNWYNTFNDVRTAFFKKKAVFNGLLPASTGIGGANRYRTSIIAGASAIQPKNDRISMENIPSPLQGSAFEYGSSFSRAVQIETPHYSQVLVSGTASIDPDGNTLHVGDVEAQINQTLKVVEAILRSRGMTYSDVSRVYAYVKREKDTLIFTEYRKRYNIPEYRVIVVPNDICREDLLFEIEVDAYSVKKITNKK